MELDRGAKHGFHQRRCCARLLPLVVGFLVATLPGEAAGAEVQNGATVVDRIVAVVNDEVITLGQLQRAVEMAAAPGRLGQEVCGVAGPPAGTEEGGPADAGDDRTLEVLGCLVDRLLVFQHVRRFPRVGVTSETVDRAFRELVVAFDSEAAFEEELKRWNLSRETIRRDLERQLMVADYVDSRFRSIVEITANQVQAYYEGELANEMRRRGAPRPPLEEVEEQIRRLLTEREVNRRVDAWIADLRSRAEITVYTW